jgi:hypothetical protein
MTINNLFIRFKNGSTADYEIENDLERRTFLDDYVGHLKSGTTVSEVKLYSVKQGDVGQTLAIDFSTVGSVAITPPKGRPA